MTKLTEDICAQCPKMRATYLDFARSYGCGTTEANINLAFRDYLLNKNSPDKKLQPCDSLIRTFEKAIGKKIGAQTFKDSISIEKLSYCEDGACKILEDNRKYLEHLESRKEDLHDVGHSRLGDL
ncbi:MAG: hypothetical protein KJ697_01115 [Nanoarchaeota archaeon]|nr:hypothetical protein [Nanoarchaeota archaeon]